ncbi:hypothetical protein ECG_00064 [Echinococcus granulosus]|nr:hypothetical protein ECG_00064 [Echinococcus granulosus]
MPLQRQLEYPKSALLGPGPSHISTLRRMPRRFTEAPAQARWGTSSRPSTDSTLSTARSRLSALLTSPVWVRACVCVRACLSIYLCTCCFVLPCDACACVRGTELVREGYARVRPHYQPIP